MFVLICFRKFELGTAIRIRLIYFVLETEQNDHKIDLFLMKLKIVIYL